MPPTDAIPTSVVDVTPVTPAPAPVSPVVYGGFWVRVGAAIIDGIILGIVQSIITAIIGDDRTTAYAVSAIVGWVYAVYMLTTYHATLGKMALGLRVERTDGRPIDLGHAILREIPGKIISTIILGIGYLMVGWTDKKRGLHDMIADTVVVKKAS
ncbi:MAG: putative rane protein YckC, family [Parcubacteria group bacterium]|nr:putative rane protein YckC, family [Parcubacteria group bacterium]